jgi:hypothetical protein
MDLNAVSDEIRTALGTITGLRAPAWGVKRVEAPAALVALPERIVFDETYGRGKDHYPDVSVVLLIGSAEERAAIKNMAPFVAGSGAKSIKAALEAYAWTTLESLTVEWCEFEPSMTFAGTPYLAAIFHLKIIGKGA